MTDHFDDPGAVSDGNPAPAADITAPGVSAGAEPSGPHGDEPTEPVGPPTADATPAAGEPPAEAVVPTWPATPSEAFSAPLVTPSAHAYPPGSPPTSPTFWVRGEATPASGGRRPASAGLGRWIAVAAVAALIGGAVGAVVAVAAGRNSPSGNGITIKESAASPGAATVGGNVPIPKLVHTVIPAVVSIDVTASGEEDQGTGMIIASDGTVLTNNHVISLAALDGGTIKVTESGTTKARAATLVGTDPNHDVALVKIGSATGLPTVTFGNSGHAQVGDAVVAIGNALGLAQGTPTVTEGIVSALGRTVTAGDSSSSSTETLTGLIQTDAAINPGNSGGPLIDSLGQVIGMNTAVAGTTPDGTNAQNIGFAIPAQQIETLIPELEKGGVTQNGGAYLGVEVAPLTSQLRQQYGFTPQSGAVILSVDLGSPADRAGLVQGDVIVAVDGKAVTSDTDLEQIITGDHPGQHVEIAYYEGNQRRTVGVTLGSAAQAAQQAGGGGLSPFVGGSGGLFGRPGI